MEDIDVPTWANCPKCLTSMEATERGKTFVWECPSCGMVKI